MGEPRKVPAWKRGIDLAHTVCVTVEALGLARTEAGQQLRRTVVSVPSLLGEAFLDSAGRRVGQALQEAAMKLAEVAGLLSQDVVRTALPEADLAGLLDEIEGLQREIDRLLGSRDDGPSH